MATTDHSTRAGRVRRYRRIALWSMAVILGGAMLLPLGGYVYTGIQNANAQAVEDTNPRANYWRAVRGGDKGYTAVQGQETDVLVQNGGQNWRQIRNGPLANYGGWVLFAVLIAIVLFFGWRGRVQVEKGRSGRLVKRWSAFERLVHWYTAILFVILAITGLSLLFGRAVLIPMLGPQGFAAWADLAKDLHNFAGPAFSVGVVLMILLWIRHNFPNATDMAWIAKGGGMFSKSHHPSAGRMNGGEKIWFWFITTFGVAVVVTGFILDFPNYGQDRETMQLASLIHAAAAILWVCMWMGHAYLGTIGTEGALEGMTTGYVDANWAEQHHDVWYDEVKKKEAEAARVEPSGAGRQPA